MAALAVGMAACGVRAQSDPEPVPVDRLPTVGPSVSTQEPSSRTRVWTTRDQRLVPVFVDLRNPDLRDRLDALLRLAEEEQVPTAIPAGTRLIDVEQRAGTTVIFFTEELLEASGRDIPFALGQVVLTATEDPGVATVSVRAVDLPVLLVTADGTSVTRPLGRADFEDYLD